VINSAKLASCVLIEEDPEDSRALDIVAGLRQAGCDGPVTLLISGYILSARVLSCTATQQLSRAHSPGLSPHGQSAHRRVP
jgi:hypothetical protein